MARVITFSTKFPGKHPRKGQPTDFVGKIWASLLKIDYDLYSDYLHPDGRPDHILNADHYIKKFGNQPKGHTIRGGNRWKVGDKFSPRIWSGRPYNSKQITIAPEITIKKVWAIEFEWDDDTNAVDITIDGRWFCHMSSSEGIRIAWNDGLHDDDFVNWFNIKENKPFVGQVICWDEKIKYGHE